MSEANEPLEEIPMKKWGVALTTGLAAFGAYGYLLGFGALDAWQSGAWNTKAVSGLVMANFAVVFQFAGNMAIAPALRRLLAWDMRASSRACAVGLFACGAFNAISIHHAFEAVGMISKDSPLYTQAMFWALSAMIVFVEPMMYWADETMKSEAARRAREYAAKAKEADRAHEIAMADREHGRLKALTAAGSAALTVVGGTAHVSANEPLTAHMAAHGERVIAHDRSRPPIVSTNTGYASAREHALALKAQGERSVKAIAAQVGRPQSTVSRWLREGELVSGATA